MKSGGMKDSEMERVEKAFEALKESNDGDHERQKKGAIIFLESLIRQVKEAAWIGDIELKTEQPTIPHREIDISHGPFLLTLTMSMQNKPKPNPCMFCTSINVQLNAYSYGGRDNDLITMIVQCEDCGAKGPKARSNEEAIKLWNRRA